MSNATHGRLRHDLRGHFNALKLSVLAAEHAPVEQQLTFLNGVHDEAEAVAQMAEQLCPDTRTSATIGRRLRIVLRRLIARSHQIHARDQELLLQGQQVERALRAEKPELR